MAMATGGQLDMTPRFARGGVPLHQMSGLGTFSEELVCPEISTIRIDDEVPLTRAALIGCGVLTGFGAAANTADVRRGRHGRGHRLRRCRPQRDPGREVQGCGAHHRDRSVRLEAEARRGVRRHRPREREGHRRGRGGPGAHRWPRRRRLVRGDRAQGNRAAGARDGAARWAGDHRRRAQDGADHGDPHRDGAARQREAGPRLVVRVVERAARRPDAHRPLQARAR